MSGAHHTERRAVAHAGQRSRVAEREHLGVLGHDVDAVLADATVGRHVLVRDALRLGDRIT